MGLQVRVSMPHMPQLRLSVAPAVHSPSPMQVPHVPHMQLPLQVRVWVPQLPHPRLSTAPGPHSPSPVHVL